jgi:hypothetical protein
MTSYIGQHLLTALVSRFEAERAEALAILNLYLGVPVGVGDHPNIIDELHAATMSLVSAEEGLETLGRHFVPPDQTTDSVEDDG